MTHWPNINPGELYTITVKGAGPDGIGGKDFFVNRQGDIIGDQPTDGMGRPLANGPVKWSPAGDPMTVTAWNKVYGGILGHMPYGKNVGDRVTDDGKQTYTQVDKAETILWKRLFPDINLDARIIPGTKNLNKTAFEEIVKKYGNDVNTKRPATRGYVLEKIIPKILTKLPFEEQKVVNKLIEAEICERKRIMDKHDRRVTGKPTKKQLEITKKHQHQIDELEKMLEASTDETISKEADKLNQDVKDKKSGAKEAKKDFEKKHGGKKKIKECIKKTAAKKAKKKGAKKTDAKKKDTKTTNTKKKNTKTGKGNSKIRKAAKKSAERKNKEKTAKKSAKKKYTKKKNTKTGKGNSQIREAAKKSAERKNKKKTAKKPAEQKTEEHSTYDTQPGVQRPPAAPPLRPFNGPMAKLPYRKLMPMIQGLWNGRPNKNSGGNGGGGNGGGKTVGRKLPKRHTVRPYVNKNGTVVPGHRRGGNGR